MKFRLNKYIYHIFGSLAFLMLPLLLSPRPPGDTGGFFSPPSVRDLIANVLILIFFYLNYYVLIDALYFKKKYIYYFALVIVSFLIIITIPSFLTGNEFSIHANNPVGLPHGVRPDRIPFKPNDSFLQEIGHHIYLFSAVVLFSILLQVNSRLLRSDKERIAAELAHLKAQIHPHFLFNTLNSIYALTIRKDERAPESIVKLAEFMRYLLRDANENEVGLGKEIDYISNYLDLQAWRLTDSVKLTYQLSGNPQGKKIAPLLLFSFIENAFKHGVNPDQDSEINIAIHIEGHLVKLLVKNRMVEIRSKEYSTNIGLTNTKERLILFYPDKHTLEINQDAEFFEVNLSIKLS